MVSSSSVLWAFLDVPDIIWYGICIWAIWASCPGSVPSQSPSYPKTTGLCGDKVLTLYKHSSAIANILVFFQHSLSYKCKAHTIRAARKQADSMPAQHSTTSTPHSMPSASWSSLTFSDTSKYPLIIPFTRCVISVAYWNLSTCLTHTALKCFILLPHTFPFTYYFICFLFPQSPLSNTCYFYYCSGLHCSWTTTQLFFHVPSSTGQAKNLLR